MAPSAPSTDRSEHWSVSVYQVSTASMQQRVLRALRHIDRPGVRVLSAQSDNHQYVIVDSERLADAVHSQRVIMTLDRNACRTFSSREHQVVATPTKPVPSLTTSRRN